MPSTPSRPGDVQDLPASTIDAIFKILSHSYRRYALVALREQRSMALGDLADEVAARAHGASIDSIPEEDVEQVFRSLYHTHIPRLVSANMVDYDQSSATVTIRDAARQAAPFLSMVDPAVPTPG